MDDTGFFSTLNLVFSLSQHGLMWTDRKLRVLACNRVAENIYRQADGIRLRDQRLSLQRFELARDLESYALDSTSRPTNAAAEPQAGRLLFMRRVERPSCKAPYFIAAMSVTSPGGQPGLLVLLEDLDAHPALHADVCRVVYGLTPAETRVALRLRRGRSAPGIATDLKLSTLTVRTHMKHVFRKVGVRSQSQLMAALCRVAFLPVGNATTWQPTSSSTIAVARPHIDLGAE